MILLNRSILGLKSGEVDVLTLGVMFFLDRKLMPILSLISELLGYRLCLLMQTHPDHFFYLELIDATLTFIASSLLAFTTSWFPAGSGLRSIQSHDGGTIAVTQNAKDPAQPVDAPEVVRHLFRRADLETILLIERHQPRSAHQV